MCKLKEKFITCLLFIIMYSQFTTAKQKRILEKCIMRGRSAGEMDLIDVLMHVMKRFSKTKCIFMALSKTMEWKIMNSLH